MNQRGQTLFPKASFILFFIILISLTSSFISDLKTQICMCTPTFSKISHLTLYRLPGTLSVSLPLYKVIFFRNKTNKKHLHIDIFAVLQLTLSASIIIGGVLMESWAVILKLE